MKDKQKKPLQIALLGMDGRSYKTMAMFLNGPCKGEAMIVEEHDADVDIVDADVVHSKQILEKCLAREQKRPIIVLSLQKLNVGEDDYIIYLKKPVVTDAMLDALQRARDIVGGKVKNKAVTTRPVPTIASRNAENEAATTKAD
jgi:hypothetical protein